MSANPLPADLAEVIEFLHRHPEIVALLQDGGVKGYQAVAKAAELIIQKFHLTPKP